MMNLRFVGVILLMAFSLGSCGKSKKEDLTHYIDEVKSRQFAAITPLPEFQPLALFRYPEHETRRNPFTSVVPKTFVAKSRVQSQVGQCKRSIRHVRSALVQINYAQASDIANLMKDRTNSLLSAQGRMMVDQRTNTIWLQDNELNVMRIREVIRKLDRPVKQVQIEARIVNINKEAILDLGIRFGVSNSSHLSGTLNGANQLLQGMTTLADRLNVDFGVPVQSPATIGIALAKLGNGILLDMELSALESQNKAEIVANPRLVTSNQQPAVIESGEEIPYQEATLSGATAVSFKKAVLSLKVTPQINPNNRLLMDLEINQDMPSGQLINGVPAITTKAIHTKVLVSNGQTLVLGGIYKQDKMNTIKRVPFLGNIPVIGVLFRSLHNKVKNEELLIFITPRIITDDSSIANSVDGVRDKAGIGRGVSSS